MQVSTIAELDTHAVIGGGEAKAFGMDDSAELYALLSDKIYRDKKRAAMRETICNAWDAHIMAGKTDTPIEIITSPTEIKIRDFGPGIPEDMLHPIYCIYGKSTKVKDENQTGGFGLGSKSPFAVTDHFSIVNHHAGFKSVHAISRGGVATDGKPQMRQMVRVPSIETGLTVSIPVQDSRDILEFERHIRAVVLQGGMLATLNGLPLARYEFTEARKHEFCVIPKADLTEGRVYVLYGTVMYPLTNTDHAMTRLAYTAVSLIGTKSLLVLIPPPNSIGVTPSREALSFSPLTDETLNRLLNKAINEIERTIDPASREALHDIVAKRDRLTLDNYIQPNDNAPQGVLSTPYSIALHAVTTNGPKHLYGGENTRRHVYRIAQKLHRDDRRFYRRAIRRFDDAPELEFQRTSMPFLRIASKMGLLKELMLFDIHAHRYDYSGTKTKPIGEYRRRGRVHPVLCVARNLRDLRPMLAFESRNDWSYSKENYLPGLVLRQWTDKNIKLLRELCEKFQVQLKVFDYDAAKAKRKPTKRKTELEKFFILEDFGLHMIRAHDRAPSCEKPSFYLNTWQRDEKPKLPFYDHLLMRVKELYPNTALITTKAQEEKLQKMGARNLGLVMAERLVALTKKREVIYGEAIRHDRFIKDADEANQASCVHAALVLAKKDMTIAKLLFPDRATPGKDHDEAAFIWDFFDGVEYLPKDVQDVVNAAKNGLKAATGKTFKIMRRGAAEKHFAYLLPICGAWFISGRYHDHDYKSFHDELVETIRFLQRRAKQQRKFAQPVASNVNTSPLKEAA